MSIVNVGIQYEEYCMDLLASKGYRGIRATKASGDQGIDIVAFRDNVKFGFQCKYYSSPVGNHAVQEAFAGAKFYGCNVAVVITNTVFTDAAKKLANNTGVVLWENIEMELQTAAESQDITNSKQSSRLQNPTSPNSNHATSFARKKSPKRKVISFLIVALPICLIVYSFLPKCYICGKRTLKSATLGGKPYYVCAKDYSDILKNTNNIISSELKDEDKVVVTEPPFHAERPYYGMDAKYIDKTDLGEHDHVSQNAYGGYDYAFYADSSHTLLVKTTRDGTVDKIQYLEKGNVLWSETSTGYHDWTK